MLVKLVIVGVLSLPVGYEGKSPGEPGEPPSPPSVSVPSPNPPSSPGPCRNVTLGKGSCLDEPMVMVPLPSKGLPMPPPPVIEEVPASDIILEEPLDERLDRIREKCVTCDAETTPEAEAQFIEMLRK